MLVDIRPVEVRGQPHENQLFTTSCEMQLQAIHQGALQRSDELISNIQNGFSSRERTEESTSNVGFKQEGHLTKRQAPVIVAQSEGT